MRPITRTRVADDTWVFTSKMYVEVNAGLVVTPEGGILIDTLPFPSETKQIINFAKRICPTGIKYVVNTISHSDHVNGSCLFPDAELIAHEECRALLVDYGEMALNEAKEHTPELRNIELRLPKIVFSDGMLIRLGEKTVHLIHSPSTSPDVCAVHVREDKVLFASDLMMPVPMISTPFSDLTRFKTSLLNLYDYNLESIIQGHGDILLRGEVESSIEDNVKYITKVEQTIRKLVTQGASKDVLYEYDIEQFHRSRIPLGGLVQQLHQQNLEYQWDQAMLRQDELLFADDENIDDLIQEKLFAKKKFKEPLFEEA
ncbi:MAG: MBL fold metallo-hydrolase [Chloroflexota bacterium]